MRVIVTGAASGIGAAVARGLAAGRPSGGPHAMLLVDRDAEGLARIVDEVGNGAIPFVADLASPDCGDAVAAAAIDALGGVDGLVSNAGAILGKSLVDLTCEEFDRMFAINTRATWLLARAVHPLMKTAGGGSIVATASISASHATPALGAYSASKAALVMIVNQLAATCGVDNIRCNTVSPGPTLTAMTAPGYADDDRRRRREASLPLGRLGTAEDVANAILFLLGDEARNITGIDLLVDGGLSTTLMSASGAGSGQSGSSR